MIEFLSVAENAEENQKAKLQNKIKN